MRSKTILSIIAFIAAFGISVAITPRTATSYVTPAYQPKRCTETARLITNLLEQDIANGRSRDRKMYQVRKQGVSSDSAIYHLNHTAAILAYYKASNSINTQNLPGEFLSAWSEHMNAWEAYADFLNENVDSDGNILREKSFYRSSAAHTREISETWYKVLRLARTYGAEIPAGAY